MPMSQLSLDKFGENLPVSGIVGFSQVAIGLGAAALVPLVWGIASKISSRPDSSRAMRKRLEGIRGEFDDSDQE